MTRYSLLIFFIASKFLFSQDSTKTERIYRMDEEKLYYQSVEEHPFTILMDSVTFEPVSGWLIKDDNKSILVEHYFVGKKNGFELRYELKKQEYHLIKASYFANAVNNPYLSQVLCFDWKRQYIDSNSCSYGLNKIQIFNTEELTGNKHLWRRDINLRKMPYRIKDRYYFKLAKRSVKINYKSKSLKTLWNTEFFDSVQFTFPYMLNENKNPFTLLRFDGYYQKLVHFGEKNQRYSTFIKFFPNGMVKYISLEGVIEEFNDWDNAELSYYKLKGNTIHFLIEEAEATFTEGKFFPTFFYSKTRYNNQISRNEIFDFIKENRE